MIVPPRWRKVLRDLWGNKVRTMLVVLSIAIGVFAMGMIVGTRVLLAQDLSAAYAASNPAHATLYPDRFTAELLPVIRRVPGVENADARADFRLAVQLAPGEWMRMNITVPADFDDLRLHTITPEKGNWPPGDREIVIERASLSYLPAGVGQTLTVEGGDGRLRELTISGTAHDIFTDPVQFSNQPNAYVTLETMAWLGYGDTLEALLITVRPAGMALTKERIGAVAAAVENKVGKSGRQNYYTWIPEPGEHPANEIVEPLLAILGALGMLSLIASGFLVVNIINGMLAQHTQQIGIMKAVGARRRQIFGMYIVAVITLGLLSLIVAIPLGGLAAYGLTRYIAGLINFDLAGFRIPLQVMGVQLGVAVLAPLLAAFLPVLHGTAITVREALSEQGLGQGQYGSSALDRVVNWLTGRMLSMSRPLQISLRNTIRRKARLVLTLVTLTLGGAIFIGVLSVHASLLGTLDDALAYFAYDVDINFDRSHRLEDIQREVQRVPGVSAAESWIGAGARRVLAGEEGEQFTLLGTVAETSVIQPLLQDGRWLRPDDTNALVINSLVLKEEPDIAVGDWIELNIEERTTSWEVVGIVQGVMTGGIAYANQPYLARVLNFVGKANGVQIVADEAAGDGRALEIRLREHLDSVGMSVASSSRIAETRVAIEYQFGIVVTLLVVMAILVALVGGLGLMGTMSINVLERTREIGVMRAVGASDGIVLRIVIVEGVLVGILSWLLGGVLAFPLGQALSEIVGTELLESSLNYVFALNGAVGWLVGIIFIGTMASFLPAWNASKFSVRQTLAYE